MWLGTCSFQVCGYNSQEAEVASFAARQSPHLLLKEMECDSLQSLKKHFQKKGYSYLKQWSTISGACTQNAVAHSTSITALCFNHRRLKNTLHTHPKTTQVTAALKVGCTSTTLQLILHFQEKKKELDSVPSSTCFLSSDYFCF